MGSTLRAVRRPQRPGGDLRTARPAGAARAYSAPERVGLAGLGAAAAAAGISLAGTHVRLGLPCPLRALTGVPCPLCGMTTAAGRLAGGHLAAALAANPFVLLVAGMTAVMSALVAARALGLAPPPRPWPASRTRNVRRAICLFFVTSWIFQLHRFGWL
jgi:hypothetical protein